MEPLRAVILDNDETTGSYLILHSIIKSIKYLGNNIDPSFFGYILEKLAVYMVRESIFRPGLIEFLRTLVKLKKEGKIDAIIMYTNQNEPNQILSSSLPRCIQYMFMFLVPGFVFDKILSRPENPTTVNNVYPKQFKRVLDLYPERPLDISNMLFFDDLAIPLYVRADGIEIISNTSWVLVEPYVCILYKEDIQDCIKFCLDDMADIKTFTDSVIKFYSTHKVNISANTPRPCSYFTELVNEKFSLS